MTTTTARVTLSPPPATVGGGDPRPGSYERISHFTEGRTGAEVKRGVDRQFADACKAAGFLGLPEPVRYTDNDQSASEFATKERDRWPEFLDDIRTGRINRPMFWLFDRAFRTTEASDAFIRACREGGALIVQTGGWAPMVCNPHDPGDVKRMKDAANQAEYEVAVMSMRQRRHKEAMADAGVNHGGRRRFGYLMPMEAGEHPTEGPIVRELVDRFLSGESLYALAKWLNDSGVPTPSTEYRLAKAERDGVDPATVKLAKWTGPNLRGLLGAPHIAGRRIHKGEDVGQAAWPALITEAQHEAARHLLDNPDRRPKGATNVRKYLLPGIMVCDECEAGVRSRPAYVNTSRSGRNKRDRAVPASYSCPSGKHAHRPMAKVDQVVEMAIVKRLTDHDAAGLFVDDTAAEELITLRDQREAVTRQQKAYAGRVLTMDPEAYEAATNALAAEVARLDEAIKGAATKVRQASRVLEGATGPGAAEAWYGTEDRPGWSLARKRSIIAEVAEVRLRGGRQGTTARGTRFNPRDVVIRFK